MLVKDDLGADGEAAWRAITFVIELQIVVVVMAWLSSVGWAVAATVWGGLRTTPAWAQQWRQSAIWTIVIATVIVVLSTIVGAVYVGVKGRGDYCVLITLGSLMGAALNVFIFVIALDILFPFLSKPDFADEGSALDKWKAGVRREASVLAGQLYEEAVLRERADVTLRDVAKDYKIPGWYVELTSPVAPELFKEIQSELAHPDYDIVATADRTRVDGRGYLSFLELRPATFDGPSASSDGPS